MTYIIFVYQEFFDLAFKFQLMILKQPPIPKNKTFQTICKVSNFSGKCFLLVSETKQKDPESLYHHSSFLELVS
jgi:hypothetical protein